MESVFISPPLMHLAVGDTLTPTASSGGPACARPPLPVFRWSWRSSDTTIATVDSTTGRITARAPGSAAVRATLVGAGASGEAHVEVSAR